MPKKLDRKIIPVTVKLFKGDAQALAKHYGEYNWVIRKLVSTHLAHLHEIQNQQESMAISELKLNINLESTNEPAKSKPARSN